MALHSSSAAMAEEDFSADRLKANGVFPSQARPPSPPHPSSSLHRLLLHSHSQRWLSISVAFNAILLMMLLCEKGARNDAKLQENPSVAASVKGGVLQPVAVQSDALLHPCSGHGFLLPLLHSSMNADLSACKCYACFRGETCSEVDRNCVMDLVHGDPTMFEAYWRDYGPSVATVILGWQRMSYFAETESICWFLDYRLANAIRALHHLVGNAVTEGHHILVGTGSTQLFQAVLYALSPVDGASPTAVVCEAPYYSSYPLVTDYLKSRLFQWGGDATVFDPASVGGDKYIELVTSPNNPDGQLRHSVLNGSGRVVHDFAYYWPQYAPITATADHEIMLFTASKSTGHAGTRIGWALVKDPAVARKMTMFLELNTIGVSQDAQLRAAEVLNAVVRSHNPTQAHPQQRFFHHAASLLQHRWAELRSVVALSDAFSLPDLQPHFCNFFSQTRTTLGAFAWLKCNRVTDCQEFMRQNGIIVRSGIHFGSDLQHVRMNMLDRTELFEILMDRLATIQEHLPA